MSGGPDTPRRWVHGALLYFLLFGLGLASVVWNLAAVLLYPVLPAGRGQALGRAAISFSYRFFWAVAQRVGMMRIDYAALEPLRDEPGGLVIAANHPSMLDALLIVACLPRSVCIMKASLMGNVFLGAGARLARYIRNDSARGMIRGAVTSLREGAQLVVFPEGTRTVTPPINAFMPGVTLIAHLAQVPIQTVIIETDSPYLGKGWPIWRSPPVPVRFSLRLGERFAPEADHAALSSRLERYFRQELAP
jgi:1-acyl-sn-glycerol-3-phosphate acyltransferase